MHNDDSPLHITLNNVSESSFNPENGVYAAWHAPRNFQVPRVLVVQFLPNSSHFLYLAPKQEHSNLDVIFTI